MSLSCARLRVFTALGIALFGAMLGSGALRVASGQLPHDSAERLVAVGVIGVLLVGLIALLVGMLTARVITDETGVRLTWFARQRSFTWDEIDDITLARHGRMWLTYLHTTQGRYRVVALTCPVLFTLQFAETEVTEPPRFLPGSIRKPFVRLREEWRRHRTPAAA